jgi:hypothetical protein
MSLLLMILLAIDAAIFLASQLWRQGYAVADQVCLSTFGMCDRPLWLGGAAAVLLAASVVAPRIK